MGNALLHQTAALSALRKLLRYTQCEPSTNGMLSIKGPYCINTALHFQQERTHPIVGRLLAWRDAAVGACCSPVPCGAGCARPAVGTAP